MKLVDAILSLGKPLSDLNFSLIGSGKVVSGRELAESNIDGVDFEVGATTTGSWVITYKGNKAFAISSVDPELKAVVK